MAVRIPHRSRFAMLAAGLLLAACATRFDIGDADIRTLPEQAAAELAAVRGKSVAWGGTVVGTRNLADHTQLEILAYPLDARNRPDRDARPGGRFLALHSGYLETADYKEGRLVTVVGTVTETRTGSVGEARYVYPVVKVSRLQLWPTPEQEAAQPQFHFGVGVGITR
jgi:outer membrane lipoprotein